MTIHKAKEIADLTIQFWYDDKGLCFMNVCKNEMKIPWLMSNAKRFGEGLAHNQLNEHDFEMLDIFCQSYLAEREKIVKKRDEQSQKIDPVQTDKSTKH